MRIAPLFYLDRIYRILRIFLPFLSSPLLAGRQERQKPISLFEGVHWAIKTQ
jgi:hypothetical protein